MTEGERAQAATLAWICAANVERAVKQWSADLRRGAPKDPPSTEALQVGGLHMHILHGQGLTREKHHGALLSGQRARCNNLPACMQQLPITATMRVCLCVHASSPRSPQGDPTPQS